ncbi:hypothetical protein MIND_00248700 [Mycena indigotica]|uniref:Methyltransferase domain-containing protein n=1 Tax=Mycena indigotica TaxID=2126181 RepID=A0A8H6T8V6_9AGAR|nr:uncharacterized protein MIND_00248700 [Mycena indigotica]KAF7312356.1 hypothetical protein MIND_00248700 [Mycena indigotica]
MAANTDYAVGPDELALLQAETGIHDETELKEHVLAIQQQALTVYDYPCIRRFGFVRLKISKNKPAYEHVLQLARLRPNSILLELGCCCGTDLRKIVRDGWAPSDIVASDLHPEYWSIGHKLFKSTPESFPVTFLAGDAFDDAFLSTKPLQTGATPQLDTISSLNELRGHVSVIHTASLFHLFGEAQQLELARRLAGLLSLESGSIIFGCHAGLPSQGFTQASDNKPMFCHSPTTWCALWDGTVFEQGMVEARAVLKSLGKVLNEETDFYLMFWSVKRL